MIKAIQWLGQITLDKLASLGRSGWVLFGFLWHFPEPRRMFGLWMRQMYLIGVLSISIVCISGLFIGMVLGLQGYTLLVDFGTEDSLGPMVALSLLRELGPVVTALLFSGRAGSAVTAEIGLMKATEQLSSLEMMAVDPLRQILAPRFWAGFVSLPLLTFIFVAIGIIGGHLVGVSWKGIDDGTFWSILQASVDWQLDIVNCFIKSMAFAVLIMWLSVFNGYNAMPNPEGISRATTATVVQSSLGVLGVDFILTAMMFGK